MTTIGLKSELRASGGRMVILAPPMAEISPCFANVTTDDSLHAQLLRQMQWFRGQTYMEDGAVQQHQLSQGCLHREDSDNQAWHLLMLRQNGAVYGCSRLMLYGDSVKFHELAASRSALALLGGWQRKLRSAVEVHIESARQQGIGFAEAGGWALAHAMRHSADALRIALGTYGLANLLGGCLGIATATMRHSSASILRRLGGQSLQGLGEELPRYFDARYGCEMEILRFDSRSLSRRFAPWADELRKDLVRVPLVRSKHSLANLHDALCLQNRSPKAAFATF
jgi:hypothetical protein